MNYRLYTFLEKNGILGPDQAGFRKDFSTMDHIFTLKCLLDIYLSKKKKLYCCFLDYTKVQKGTKNNRSECFNCMLGVRQGENLSPVLFALYLNDLTSFLSDRYHGLETVNNMANELLEDEQLETFIRLCFVVCR